MGIHLKDAAAAKLSRMFTSNPMSPTIETTAKTPESCEHKDVGARMPYQNQQPFLLGPKFRSSENSNPDGRCSNLEILDARQMRSTSGQSQRSGSPHSSMTTDSYCDFWPSRSSQISRPTSQSTGSDNGSVDLQSTGPLYGPCIRKKSPRKTKMPLGAKFSLASDILLETFFRSFLNKPRKILTEDELEEGLPLGYTRSLDLPPDVSRDKSELDYLRRVNMEETASASLRRHDTSRGNCSPQNERVTATLKASNDITSNKPLIEVQTASVQTETLGVDNGVPRSSEREIPIMEGMASQKRGSVVALEDAGFLLSIDRDVNASKPALLRRQDNTLRDGILSEQHDRSVYPQRSAPRRRCEDSFIDACCHARKWASSIGNKQEDATHAQEHEGLFGVAPIEAVEHGQCMSRVCHLRRKINALETIIEEDVESNGGVHWPANEAKVTEEPVIKHPVQYVWSLPGPRPEPKTDGVRAMRNLQKNAQEEGRSWPR